MGVLLSLSIGLLWAPLALASPTANEFERCHRGAALSLQHCLSEAGMGDGGACWPQARAYHEDCRRKVVQEHQPPDAARVEAMREAARRRQAVPGARP
ncbi:hypothetical protein [Hydrogenophaga sp. IBVHS1]|jgi:hypothetical protein|uniref:hypothetical protein n=1 Tax=unclassified Hydrogenophaga TaxID=2610897 RepID=UPI000A2D293D|nr:hypothetical protein [Hydrogenophaga sp. IBVHS1]OSZ71646.1 hypothetical protein CAP37_20750 [Hydrogenophaga sp. IBVHS1]